MRKLIVSATAAALLASGSVAFAAVKHTTGTIKTYRRNGAEPRSR